MPCPKCSETLKRCPDGIQSSDCMKYVGQSNTCLDFCKGQSVSEVIEQIGEETCKIKQNTDVSDISILDLCSELRNAYNSKGYDEQNVKNLIDFLLFFDCVLQGQINTINNNLTTFIPTVIADWSCLASSPCITTGSVNLNTAIQNIINAFCAQQNRIEDLEKTICQQQKSIQALNNSIECLITKLNVLNVDLNFGSCQVSINPNPPC